MTRGVFSVDKRQQETREDVWWVMQYSTDQKKPNRERLAERVLFPFCMRSRSRSVSVPFPFP